MVCLASILLAGVLIPPLVSPSSAWNDPTSNQYHIQTDEGPERYFKYQTQNGQYRKEKRLQDGTVIGTYAWIDGNGFLRQRDYIADGQGYRIVKNKNLYVGTDANIGDAMKAAKKVQNDYVEPNRINRVRNRGYVSITPKPIYAPSVELSLNSIQSSTPQTYYSSSSEYEAPSSSLSPPAVSYIDSSTARPQASTSYLPPVSSTTLPPLVSSSPSSVYLPASTPPPVSYPPSSVYLAAAPPVSFSYIPPSSTPSPVAYIPPSSTPSPVPYIPPSSTPSQVAYIPPSSTPSPVAYIPPFPTSSPAPHIPPSPLPYIPPSSTSSPALYIPPSRAPYIPPSSTPSTIYLPASKPRPFAPPVYLPPSTTPSYVKITPPSRKYVPQSINSNSIEYSGNPQYEHYDEDFVNPYIHQNGPTYPLDKNGHSFNAKYANIGNGYDPQYPYYDGISVTNDGFRYYIPRAYHEEQNTGYGDSKQGSFGYIDPFGIRRVIYYNAGPDGFKHRKNNRYVGFDATPYDPRPY